MPEYDRSSDLEAFDNTKAGVQGLASVGVAKLPRIFVDEQFILEEKKVSKLSIPEVDLGPLIINDAAARGCIVDKVKAACQEWGFFKIVNHGIPTSSLNNVIDAVKGFHEQEAETKKQYYTRDYKKKVVYNSNFDLYKAAVANWRDSLNLVMAPTPPDPLELPEICRDTMMEYSKQMKSLSIILLELMSEALGLSRSHLIDMDCAEGQFVACNYYPACPEPDMTLGFASHTDNSFLTVLLQDEIGGLQVLHKDQWVDVPPHPGSLLVIIGDMLQMITNDAFKSVYHRVLAKNVGPRISVASAFRLHVEETCSSKLYGPIKELLSDENPPIYREAKAQEIVECRFAKGIEKTPLLSYFKLFTHTNMQ